jgi:hypothetical protein
MPRQGLQLGVDLLLVHCQITHFRHVR